jgi:hypothetical protein
VQRLPGRVAGALVEVARDERVACAAAVQQGQGLPRMVEPRCRLEGQVDAGDRELGPARADHRRRDPARGPAELPGQAHL